MKRVYVNEPVCMGCHLCEVACLLKHAQTKDLVKAYKKESPRAISRVRVDESGIVSLSVRCQHCTDAPCLRACLTGALSRDPATLLITVDMVKAGVNVITSHTVQSVNGYQTDKVSGVTLDDGRLLPCDLVIIAIGVKPRLDLVAGSSIKINRGIIVDRYMTTSSSDIYACGDIAEAYDFVIGENRLTPIWPNAYESGRVAGLNMAGQPTEYSGGTAMNALKYFGLNIVSAGLVNPPDNSYEVIINSHDGVYRKVIIKSGKIVGLAFSGDIEKSGIIYNLMKDGVDVSAFKQSLVADDFGLASLPESIWRSRLPKPSPASVLITPAEQPEEATIGD